MADDDARDERIAELLDVEPLDDVTRRRLVGAALRASAPESDRSAGTRRLRARTDRWLAAAAVVAVLVAGGLGYLATRDDDKTTAPSAAPAEAKTPPSVSTQERADAGSTAADAAAAPSDAGDFGDLRAAANLARLRAALGPAGATRAFAAGRADSLVAELGTRPCASELPDGTVVGLATASLGDRDAIVVATDLPDGTRSIDAVLDDPCEVRPLD
jgi:hypothetical protein